MIYVHDSWPFDVPDTFAILPRNASHTFFNMDEKYFFNATCLGGPNLDLQTLNTEALKHLGYNDIEIKLVEDENCFNKYPTYSHSHDGKSKTVWTRAGVSENILKRKLKLYGYEIKLGNIGIASLFMFLIRYPYDNVSVLVFIILDDSPTNIGVWIFIGRLFDKQSSCIHKGFAGFLSNFNL